MLQFFNNIRTPSKKTSLPKQISNTLLILLLGLSLGLFSKILDCIPSNDLPYLLQVIDLTNFLGRMAIYILLAVAISIYSNTPVRAGIHVFIFFSGMLISYYTYTKYVAGFFPKSYIMIWVAFTLASPFLAYVCWFSKGKGIISLLLSSTIVGILFTQAFFLGLYDFYIIHSQEVIVWIISIILLYKSPKQLLQMLGFSLIIAFLWRILSPFSFI